MSQRLTNALEKKPLFIPFITAGDPVAEATIELALKLEESGASVLELGIPYSDPLADGPTIQEASKRALAGGMSLEKALRLVPKMRARGLTIPVIVFTYANPLLQYGYERFCKEAGGLGIDGVLVPDLPFEESEELAGLCARNDLAVISLVAPTSKARVEKIARAAQGFVYCVSSLGVTGTRSELHPDIQTFLETVRKESSVPFVVGFGISTPLQVEQMNEWTDGVVVGSAIVREVGRRTEDLKHEGTREAALLEIQAFVDHLRGQKETSRT
ncbi:tryptophan synthase subunit alpha [Shouchella shacheensis]|uniref:tryptophan synthase subunit alpha n=1 Tax=Shouchella shacheensis TaxID=1649580 RepID=UPI0007403682|nr:tryptophan synthase subunit alpha [Shouchella shacheensis]